MNGLRGKREKKNQVICPYSGSCNLLISSAPLHLDWRSSLIPSTFISADTRDLWGLIHTSVLLQISRPGDDSGTVSMCTRPPPGQAGQQPHLLSGWLSERCYFGAALNWTRRWITMQGQRLEKQKGLLLCLYRDTFAQTTLELKKATGD